MKARATKPVEFTAAPAGVLQRQCACGGKSSGAPCPKCQDEEQRGVLQRSATRGGEVDEVPPVVHEVLREPGQPLDADTRSFFEPRFGADFSGVRVHTDPKAAESAASVHARAYTASHHIAFADGEYNHSAAGRELLAHELTHVVQQRGQTVRRKLSLSSGHDPLEREADATASRVVHDPTWTMVAGVGLPGGVYRAADDEEATDLADVEDDEMADAELDDDEVEDAELDEDESDGLVIQLKPKPGTPRRTAQQKKKKYVSPCPKGYEDRGKFLITHYTLATEGEFPEQPTVTDPCGLTGTFRSGFLFGSGVKMQGSGQAADGSIIRYAPQGGQDCFTTDSCARTRRGTCATEGRTIAVDPSEIPLGSSVYIDGMGLRTAEDTGGRITGKHIDVYVGTNRDPATLAQATGSKVVCIRRPRRKRAPDKGRGKGSKRRRSR